MFKLVFSAILIGLCVTNVFADVNEEWSDDYNDDNSYEYVPIEGGDDDILQGNKDLEQFRKDLQDAFNEADHDDYENIDDYQVEDNRSEDDKQNNDKDNENDKDIKLLRLLKAPQIDYVDNPEQENEDRADKSIESDEVADHEEEHIINLLNRKKEDTPENDIIEETKAILKEDDGNEFEKIIPLNGDISNIKDIVDETSKLLEETDNIFDDITNSTEDSSSTSKPELKEPKQEKPYEEFKSSIDELVGTWDKLADEDGDLDEKDESFYQYPENPDYYETFDDELDSKSDEETNDKLEDDSTLNATTSQPIFYLNDALSAQESTSTQADASTQTALAEKSTQAIETSVENDEQFSSKEKMSTPAMPSIEEVSTENPEVKVNQTNENIQAKFSNTVVVHLNVNDTTVVVSPNYPSAYPTNQITDYVITGDGVGIEMNVTDFAINSFVGDYVLIIPGQTEKGSSDGILASYTLKSERRFRFTDVDRMFIRFEAMQGMQFQRGFSISLRMIMPRTDVLPEEVQEPIIRTTTDSLYVNLGGVSLDGFFAIQEDFRRIIADMASMYINAKRIEVGLNTTSEVTEIVSQGICFHNWPGSDQCAEIGFSVPLRYDEDLEPRLTKQDLRDMWDTYSRQDPFAVRLELLGVVEFTFPDERGVLAVWLVAGAGVLLSAALLALVLWRCSCFEDYTKMPSYSDTDSLNDKKVLDLYPTPHQMLPPLYSDDVQWADEKYDIGQEHGYSNNSFLSDLYDMDSDDDALRSHNGYRPGVISPRDIYQV